MGVLQKDGASQPTGPAVETAFTATDGAGSHSAAVLSELVRIRALFQLRAITTAMGAGIWRTDDGGTLMLAGGAARNVDVPLSHEAHQ